MLVTTTNNEGRLFERSSTSVALGCDIARLAGHLKVTSACEKTLTELSTTTTKHDAPYNSLAWRPTEFSCSVSQISNSRPCLKTTSRLSPLANWFFKSHYVYRLPATLLFGHDCYVTVRMRLQ